MELYTRDGKRFDGAVIDRDTSKPYAMVQRACGRCGGAGRIDCYRHVEGGVCFECGGHGRGKVARVTLYTSERLARLNVTTAKRTAVKVAKFEAERAKADAEANARREAFQGRHVDVLAWLAQAGRTGEGYREGFLGDMLRAAEGRCQWTPGQESAVYGAWAKATARDAVRVASRHVGKTGERINVTATVERESTFDRPRYGYDREYETVYITTLRDDAGNALLVKSPAFRARVGAVVTVRGTVKEHSEYKGEAQTVLQRVAALSEAGSVAA